MLDLIKRFELIQKQYNLPYMSGDVNNIFVYHENSGKNEDGSIPFIIKLEQEEKKKKKSIN